MCLKIEKVDNPDSFTKWLTDRIAFYLNKREEAILSEGHATDPAESLGWNTGRKTF